MKPYQFLRQMLPGILSILICTGVKTQVSVNVNSMTRAEYRHGFSSLADSAQDPALFIGQRSRLIVNYKSEKFRVGIAAQDVRVWGSTGNLPVDTAGKFSLQEGWGELICSPKTSVKFGRQTIAYDDDRILGSLDWALQARRHDLLLFRHINDSVLTVHVGAAWNQNKDYTKGSVYSVANNYKTMQYLWLHRDMKNLGASLLFLNNGVQFTKTDTAGKSTYSTPFSQTFGTRLVFKKNKFTAALNAYYQMGKDGTSTNSDGDPKDISAYNACLDLSYKITKVFGATLGTELLSGTSQNPDKQDKNYSFNPFYGTNHRFNGYMDYFYVNNHIRSVGLRDLYLTLNLEKGKILTSLSTHMFMAGADIKDVVNSTVDDFKALDSYLGTEIDLSFSYNFDNGVAVQGGYSHLLATESMEAIKGGRSDALQNWAYLMVVIRPETIKWPRVALKL